jgi:hypothetical protein
MLFKKKEMNRRLDRSVQTKLSYEKKRNKKKKEGERKTCMNEGRYIRKRKKRRMCKCL